jgi:hypothetical protein
MGTVGTVARTRASGTDACRASRNRAVRVAVGGRLTFATQRKARPHGRAYSRSCLYLYLPLLGEVDLYLYLPLLGEVDLYLYFFSYYFWKTPSPQRRIARMVDSSPVPSLCSMLVASL